MAIERNRMKRNWTIVVAVITTSLLALLVVSIELPPGVVGAPQNSAAIMAGSITAESGQLELPADRADMLPRRDPTAVPESGATNRQMDEAGAPRSVSSEELTPGTGALRISTGSEGGAKQIETFYPSGGPMESYQTVGGRITGLYIHYHPNGTALERTVYAHGLREGESECFDPSGNRLSSGVYLGGKKEGYWLEWWDGSALRSDTRYTAGSLEGECRYYNPDGSIDTALSGTYVAGKRTQGL